MERTLVIIKPDALNRSLIGKIISRFEEKGLTIIAMKMKQLKSEELTKHYAHHKGKPFFEELLKFMSSAPSILLVLEGKDAVTVTRKICGATNAREAEPGTIRGDYSMSTQNNLVHASDSIETAEKEINMFFDKKEIYSYKKLGIEWLYSSTEK